MFEILKEKYNKHFREEPLAVFSAPGRTELGGNHTDHQHGEVIASAVDRATVAAVGYRGDMTADLVSEGFSECVIDLSDTAVKEDEKGTTASLIRGIAAWFQKNGFPVRGFNAYVTSDVLSGSGLSSSAAFEVLIGNVFSDMTSAGLSAEKIAQIGQYAENVYFGKPSGLMDQMASSVGNIVHIDFGNPDPVIEKIDYDLAGSGYVMCIRDTGADHADLTDDYAAIPAELHRVCEMFGKKYLREVDEEEFFENIGTVREKCGDRAVLRAIHVFEENKRVKKQAEALKNGDTEAFLALVNESGISSWTMLQNVDTYKDSRHQEVAFALSLARKLLGGRGACRVHGGGFAGPIQAFVPSDMADDFKKGIDRVLGEGACAVMNIGCTGAGKVE